MAVSSWRTVSSSVKCSSRMSWKKSSGRVWSDFDSSARLICFKSATCSSAALRKSSFWRRMGALANSRPSGVISTSPSRHLHESEQRRRFDDGQQIVDLERQQVGQAVDILAAVVIGENFEESRDAAGAGVRQHRVFRASVRGAELAAGPDKGNREIAVRLGQNLVNVVDDLGEAGMLAIARAWKVDMEIGADSAGILAENHDAIAQQNRFLNVVRNDEHGAGGHFLVLPQLQQFAAEVLGRQNIQGREWFIHEQHFRLHHQGTGEADALFHAARQFFRIGALEAVQANRIEHLEAAGRSAVRAKRRGLSTAPRRFPKR